MNLFEKKTFEMHSGDMEYFKIKCDALTDEDIETLAYIIARRIPFYDVFGVPTGGVRIANALEKYKDKEGYGYFLIVDDVLTTGNSMEDAKQVCYDKPEITGVVLFARGECPDWVFPVFQTIF